MINIISKILRISFQTISILLIFWFAFALIYFNQDIFINNIKDLVTFIKNLII